MLRQIVIRVMSNEVRVDVAFLLILRIGLTVQNQNRLVSIDQWKQQHHVSIGLERCLRPSEVCIDFVD